MGATFKSEWESKRSQGKKGETGPGSTLNMELPIPVGAQTGSGQRENKGQSTRAIPHSPKAQEEVGQCFRELLEFKYEWRNKRPQGKQGVAGPALQQHLNSHPSGCCQGTKETATKTCCGVSAQSPG